MTVAELLALGEGKIARNVYVEGTVISDRTTRNYPLAYLDEYTANTMFVEDATGGLWIEFDDAVDEKERITVRKHVHDVTDVERTHIGT